MYNIVILSREPRGTWNLGDDVNFSGTYLDQSVTVSMPISQWAKLMDSYRHDKGQVMNWLEYHATQEAYRRGTKSGGMEIRLSYE